MPGLSLIAGYLDTLSGQLPRPVVEELADGLEETYRRHLSLGLTSEAGAAGYSVTVAQPAANEADDDVAGGDLERVVAQADAVAGGRLARDREIPLGNDQLSFQVDGAGDAEDDRPVAFADCLAE